MTVSVRERLLSAAHALTEAEGWSSVRMGQVAESAGVSRQTVYNAFGSKHGLAEQLALRELTGFLTSVQRELEAAADLPSGIRAACETALLLGEESVLVRSVTGTSTGTDNDFLALLTTESGEIVHLATESVLAVILAAHPGATDLTREQMWVVVEAVVRLVLSAMTRPSKPPAEMAEDIAWLARRSL